MKKSLLLFSLIGFSVVSCSVYNPSTSTSQQNPASFDVTSNTSVNSNSSLSSNTNSASSSSSGNGGSSMTSNSSQQFNEGGYVVYINLDGFGRYYYDEAVSKNLVPTLESIKNEGVVFKNLKTVSPSITNPCQAMIISGATSNKTQNVYRYYDVKNNIVVQQARENEADTLYHSVKRNNVSAATVHHFPAESVFSTTNQNYLYVKTPYGEVSNYKARFDQAIKLVKGQQFQNNTTLTTVTSVPRFLTVYADDLDALGHNESAYDTFSVATSEAARVNNVVTRLSQIDGKIGELIQAYKDRGIYDKTTFFLTTDHGMQGFGAESSNALTALTNKYSKTKWPELKTKLAAINSKYIFEYVAQNKSPQASTTVVGVGSGLQMPLTFKGISVTESTLQNIKTELKKEYYISEVYTKAELLEQGYWSGANVDLLVIPAERYHFHGRDNSSNIYKVRGQHDTVSEHATNIYGAIWGANVLKLGESNIECRNVSFGSTIAKYLGIDLLDANAPVLEEIIKY